MGSKGEGGVWEDLHILGVGTLVGGGGLAGGPGVDRTRTSALA